MRNEIKVIEEDKDKHWVIIQTQDIYLAFGYLAPSLDNTVVVYFRKHFQRVTNNGQFPCIMMADLNARFGDTTGDSLICTRGRRLLSSIERSKWENLNPDGIANGPITIKVVGGSPDHLDCNKEHYI